MTNGKLEMDVLLDDLRHLLCGVPGSSHNLVIKRAGLVCPVVSSLLMFRYLFGSWVMQLLKFGDVGLGPFVFGMGGYWEVLVRLTSIFWGGFHPGTRSVADRSVPPGPQGWPR